MPTGTSIKDISPNAGHIAKDKPRTYTLDDIKRLNANTGHYFFSAGATRFFCARYMPTVYQGAGGVYFVNSRSITTSNGVTTKEYSVAEFIPATGSVKYASEHQPSLAVSKRQARDLAANGRKDQSAGKAE